MPSLQHHTEIWYSINEVINKIYGSDSEGVGQGQGQGKNWG